MRKSLESLKQEFRDNKDDKRYRHAYADESLNMTVATQIKVLRQQRDWDQRQLAEEANMKQSMISRYEDVNYSSWTISTLKRLAEAFDVIIDVRFRSFRDMVSDTCSFSRESLEVVEFSKDPFFSIQVNKDEELSIQANATTPTYAPEKAEPPSRSLKLQDAELDVRIFPIKGITGQDYSYMAT